MDTTTCPDCGSYAKIVDRQHTWNRSIKITRQCLECECEFVVKYSHPAIVSVSNP